MTHNQDKHLERNRMAEKRRRTNGRLLSHANMKKRGRCALHPIYNAGQELTVTSKNLPMFCWDHLDRNQKTSNVAKMLGKKDEETIQREINKCQLLCHNCHHMKSIEQGDHKSIEKQKTKHQTLFDL
jgi:hypothetical protein